MPSSPAYTRPTTVGTGWTAGARFSQNYENKTPLASLCAGKNGKKIITKPRYTNGTGLPETKKSLVSLREKLLQYHKDVYETAGRKPEWNPHGW